MQPCFRSGPDQRNFAVLEIFSAQTRLLCSAIRLHGNYFSEPVCSRDMKLCLKISTEYFSACKRTKSTTKFYSEERKQTRKVWIIQMLTFPLHSVKHSVKMSKFLLTFHKKYILKTKFERMKKSKIFTHKITNLTQFFRILRRNVDILLCDFPSVIFGCEYEFVGTQKICWTNCFLGPCCLPDSWCWGPTLRH